MSEYESDFTSENPDDTSRDAPRTNRHGSSVKPGQRGRGKRELGEKPLVTVKWDEAMTNQLWQMIKDDPELRPVLATDTTKSLVAPTKSTITYSKKDLQRRIAETLWKETHDINDPQILENLTRAVKNKIHKTYMLYDQVIKGLGPEFIHCKSEVDVPPEAQSKWGKAKERFPTFFAFQALKQEYEESERRATSTPNDVLQSPSYYNLILRKHIAQNPHLLSLVGQPTEDFGLGFEVVPPPADLPSDLSDGEPVHGASANHPSRSPSRSPFAQSGPLINPYGRHLDAGGRSAPAPGHASKQSSIGSTFSFSSVSMSQNTSPLQNPSPLLPPGTPSSSLRPHTDGAFSQTRGGLSTEFAVQPHPIAGADQRIQSPLLGTVISASPKALPASSLGLGFTPNLENLNLSPGSVSSSYQSPGTVAPATQAGATQPPLRRMPRRLRDPHNASHGSVGQSSGNATYKTAILSPKQPQHASISRLHIGAGTPKSPLGSSQALAVRPGTAGGHQRSHGDSMDVSSTFHEQRELSQSPSPPLPDRDSPPLTTALETLIDLHREKETQKRKREEMWVEHKRKRYEDRQRQREENERQRQENECQRLENERQRQHQEKMMEMKLELVRLSAAKEKARAEVQQAQSQVKSPSGSGTGNGSGSKSQVPLPGSTATSPAAAPPPLNGADTSPAKSPAIISRGLGPAGTNAGNTTVAADLNGGGLKMSLGLSLDVDQMSQQQFPSPSSMTGGYSGLPFPGIEQLPPSNPPQSRSSLLQPKFASIQQQLSRPFAQHQQAYLSLPPPQAQGTSAMDTPASMSLMDLGLPYEEFSMTGWMPSLPQHHTPSQQQHLALPYQPPPMHQHMQGQAQMHQQSQGQFMGGQDHSGLVLGSHPAFDIASLLRILPSSDHQNPTSQEQASHHQPPYYRSNG